MKFDFENPIVIQGALDSELDLLLKSFDVLQKRTVGDFVFYECTHKERPIVVSKTRIGEINSAAATALAITTYHPRWIINQGTAGALVEWLNTGDIVIGKRVCYLSQFSTDENKEIDAINPWKADCYRTVDRETVSYHADQGLLLKMQDICKKINREVHFEAIGSGDVWTKDPLQIHRLHQRYGVVCEAMECAGAYLTANSLGVPLLSVRVISNNELKRQAYDQASGALAQRFVLDLMEYL